MFASIKSLGGPDPGILGQLALFLYSVKEQDVLAELQSQGQPTSDSCLVLGEALWVLNPK